MTVSAWTVPAVEVAPPPVVPARFGLFSVAQQVRMDGHEFSGVLFEQPGCVSARTVQGWCPAPPMNLKDPQYSGTSWGDSAPFTVVASYNCSTVGSHEPGGEAQRRLDAVEHRQVERAVWTGRDTAGAALDARAQRLADPAAVRLGGAGAVAPVVGYGLLEEWLGLNYPGRGVIHAPRIASAIPARLTVVGQQQQTAAGTPVAFYGGSPNTGPDGSVAPSGQVWMYATPAVQIRRGDDVLIDNAQASGLGYQVNDVIGVAMRPFTVLWECGTAAVLVALPSDY